jgi:RNA polymerase sigma-70 factor (ECF subfamily)
MEKNHSGEDLAVLTALKKETEYLDWSQQLSDLGMQRDKLTYIKIYQHFAPKIKAYVMRLGLLNSTAEELMQETMLAVWHKAHLYNASKAAASTWIFTLARNKSIDWMRKQPYPDYNYESIENEANPNDNIAPSSASQNDINYENLEQLKTTDKMNSAIRRLPEEQRQVIYLSFYEGRSHVEISGRLGIPLGSVKSRIRLASQKIKMIWKERL